MVAERRRVRTEDLTSALLDAEIDGEKLTEEELDKRLDVLSMANTDRN